MDTNPVIDENQITVETPDWPNQSGGRGDIFIGHHATAGKVALKRLRLPPHVNDTEATRRVSQCRAIEVIFDTESLSSAVGKRGTDMASPQLFVSAPFPRYLL